MAPKLRRRQRPDRRRNLDGVLPGLTPRRNQLFWTRSGHEQRSVWGSKGSHPDTPRKPAKTATQTRPRTPDKQGAPPQRPRRDKAETRPRQGRDKRGTTRQRKTQTGQGKTGKTERGRQRAEPRNRPQNGQAEPENRPQNTRKDEQGGETATKDRQKGRNPNATETAAAKPPRRVHPKDTSKTPRKHLQDTSKTPHRHAKNPGGAWIARKQRAGRLRAKQRARKMKKWPPNRLFHGGILEIRPWRNFGLGAEQA